MIAERKITHLIVNDCFKLFKVMFLLQQIWSKLSSRPYFIMDKFEEIPTAEEAA